MQNVSLRNAAVNYIRSTIVQSFYIGTSTNDH